MFRSSSGFLYGTEYRFVNATYEFYQLSVYYESVNHWIHLVSVMKSWVGSSMVQWAQLEDFDRHWAFNIQTWQFIFCLVTKEAGCCFINHISTLLAIVISPFSNVCLWAISVAAGARLLVVISLFQMIHGRKRRYQFCCCTFQHRSSVTFSKGMRGAVQKLLWVFRKVDKVGVFVEKVGEDFGAE